MTPILICHRILKRTYASLLLGGFILLFIRCKSNVTEVIEPDPLLTNNQHIHTVPNSTPKLEDVSHRQNGNEITLTFKVTDDDARVEVKIFGYDANTESWLDLSSTFSGDVGPDVSIENDLQATATLEGMISKLRIEADDGYAPSLQEITNQVLDTRIANDIRGMEGIRHRTAGPDLLRNTRRQIEKQFDQCEVSVTKHYFQYNGIEGINVIGSIPGIDPSKGRYLISGHFDTVSSTPGADDNASGTAGMIEAMRVLSQYNFEHPIDFIGFDLEESGLIGSRDYVASEVANQQVNGLINFEMIGYPCRSRECMNLTLPDTSIYNIASPASTQLQNTFNEMALVYAPELKVESTVSDGRNDFRRSDHAPFWDAGIPALFITDGANFRNPHYHQPTDELSTLDTRFAANIVKTAVATIAKLAVVRHVATVTLTLGQ